MSPDIEHVTRPFIIRGSGAARILTDALNAAHARGLTVSTDADIGVVASSTQQPAWEVDPRVSAVSILGCVLLAHQPPIADIQKALTHVFEEPAEFCEGIEHGASGKPAPENAGRLYADGYFLGIQMRTLVWTVPCETHLSRYPRGQKCPMCAAGVPAQRPGRERTQPIDTPRALIASLIDSMTVAQVLEALADSIPRRGWSEDRTVDTVEDLRELAEEYRQDEGV